MFYYSGLVGLELEVSLLISRSEIGAVTVHFREKKVPERGHFSQKSRPKLSRFLTRF